MLLLTDMIDVNMARICATSTNKTINLNSNNFNDVVNNFYDWLPRPCESHIRSIRPKVPIYEMNYTFTNLVNTCSVR